MADLTDRLREALAGGEGWLVGGALRDELLGRPVVDLDVACREPEVAARAFARASGGAPFPLSERHGAWRIALEDGRTVDFTPLAAGIEDDLATRDFTLNAMARPVGGGELVDPVRRPGGHRAAHDSCSRERRLRGRSAAPAAGGPARGRARLPLRRRDGGAGSPACVPCGAAGGRADPRRARTPLGGGLPPARGARAARGARRLRPALRPDRRGRLLRLPARVRLRRPRSASLPISRSLDRYARTLLRAEPPADDSARAIHRFRRATEPWAPDALAFLGLAELVPAIEEARAHDPAGAAASRRRARPAAGA